MKSLTKIFIRLLSIFLVVKSVQILPTYILTLLYFRNDKITSYGNWVNISSVLVGIAIGVLLWVFADKVSNKFVGMDDNEINLNVKSLQIAAFSVVGLLLVVYSFPSILTNVYHIYSIYSYSKTPDDVTVLKYKLDIAENIIKTVVGIWLVFGSTGIVNLINKSRNAGLNNVEQDNNLKINSGDGDSKES